MARIRSLKPELWQDEALGTVSIEAQCLFVGLITQADDLGRLEASPLRVRALIWPYKAEIAGEQIERWLRELVEARLIVRYEAESKQCIALPGWEGNQKVDHPGPSKVPDPPIFANVREDSRIFSPDQGSRIKDQEGIGEGSLRSPSRRDIETAEQVKMLFAYWQEKCAHPGAVLSPERRRKIRDRLREGYEPQKIREAIDGAAVGAVRKGKKRHDDIELICRSAVKLDSFVGRERPPVDEASSIRAASRSPTSEELVKAVMG